MKVGELFVLLGLDPKEYQQGLRKAEKDSEVFAKNVKKNLSNIGEGLKKAGQNLSLFLTAPLALIGRNMIKMASDAVESENLFEVSMGNMAVAARQWSEDLGLALKMNRYEIRKNVSTFNVMFGSMGFGEQAAYDMSRGLTQLAYDMASFYNLRPETAFEKLQAGITGEVEPLKRLGILINETTVQQWALQKGWIKEGQQLSENQKVLARYNVIIEATRKSQGDLARTIDSPANVARAREAKLAEAQIEAGKNLLEMTKKINLALGRLAEMFLGLSPGAQSAVVWMGVLAAVTGPLLYGLGMLVLIVPRLISTFRAFFLAAVAAKAVNLLKLAVQGLFFVLTKNPIVAAVMIIAGALLALAMSSKTVRDWLDQVMARLRALAGLDYAPPAMEGADPSDVAAAYDEYAKSLAGVADGFRDTGDEAKGAGKKINKFLAAFDEVYQVSEDTDDALGSLGDILGGIGKIPPPPDGGEPPALGGGIKFPKIPTTIPPVTWPEIMPPPGAVAENFELALERIRQAAMQPIPVTALPGLIPQPETVPTWEYVLKRIKELLLQPWPVVPLPKLEPLPGLIPLWENARKGISTAIDWIKQKASEFKLPNLAPLLVWVPSWQTVTAGIVAAWQSGRDNIHRLTQDMWNVIKSYYDKAKDFVSPGVQNALAWIKQMWENHKKEILIITGLIIAGLLLWWAGVPAAIVAAISPLLPAIGALLARIPPQFGQMVARAMQFIQQLPGQAAIYFQQMMIRAQGIFNQLPNIARTAFNGIVDWARQLPGQIWDAIKSIPGMLARAFRVPSLPRPALAVPGAAAGGIFMKPSIIGIAEKEPEAAIPLSRLGEFAGGGGEVHLHVGVLVADDRGLKELERRLKNIRFSEAARGAMA